MNRETVNQLINQVVANNPAGVAAFIERYNLLGDQQVDVTTDQLTAIMQEACVQAPEPVPFLRFFLASVEYL